MTTDEPDPATSGDSGSRYLQVQQSAEFEGLRRAFRRFVFPTTVAFLVWYALYVILSAYARDFMSTKVTGHINVALIFGLLQFVTTFLIAWLYERYATNKLEPVQASLKAQVTGGPAAATVTEEEPA